MYQELWDTENKKTFDYIENQKIKLWYQGEEVWDFIIRKDLNNLSAQEFYDRIRYNKHLMSKMKGLFKWILYRLEILGKGKKYKQHI